MKIKRLLIANRGEIACRIISTCRSMGIETVGLFTPAESNARHVQIADIALALPAGPLTDNYLNSEAIITLAQSIGVDAIHPGYGFLSESADFARACEQANIIFVGPTASVIEEMAYKNEAKHFMSTAGVPTLPGYNGEQQTFESLLSAANTVGYPLLIKASAGGGGRGMRIVETADAVPDALARAKAEALNHFGNDHLILERFFPTARHIEVQVIGDSFGHVLHLGTRECSLQRRHQKVIEEAPALLPADMIERMCALSVTACEKLRYRGAGTLEFLLSPDNHFYFLEMNTRLQVEHPVTEQVTGLDLVQLQLQVSSGEKLSLKQSDICIKGHSIEARVYAEDPTSGFLPSTGKIEQLVLPQETIGVRCDTGIELDTLISPHFDPLLCKIITTGTNRTQALSRLDKALSECVIVGIKTNITFLQTLLSMDAVQKNQVTTRYIDENTEQLLSCPLIIDEAWGSIILLYWIANRVTQDLATWRLNHQPLLITQLMIEDTVYQVSLDMRTYKMHWTSAKSTFEGTLKDVHPDSSSASQSGVLFTYQGQHRFVRFFDEIPRQASLAHTDGLAAPMPGKVCAILVEKQQSVVLGEKLMILEAMKMEHTICAPYSGIISDIYVAPNQQVSASEQLLSIKESSDA